MAEHTFDALTRLGSTDRRRAMLALGAAGLAITLAGSFRTSAKPGAGKKRKKKCKKQKQACLEQVATFCAQMEGEQSDCLTLTTPCCAECNVTNAVICTANAFTTVTVIAKDTSRNHD